MARNTASIANGSSGIRQRFTEPAGLAGVSLHWSARSLVAASWVSGAIFAIYIIAFFGGVAFAGASDRWNESLPGLYDTTSPLATIAIGAHFITGGVLLLLGPVQLIGGVRRNFPALHRWLGRLYVVSAGLAGLGGLGFILARGTIGGSLMDVGFGIYGALMILCATNAYLHARAQRYEQHRAWAIRLFALTVGSWLYRMEYAFWFLLTDGLGRSSALSGWFDAIMVFFFYVPNLVVAELFIRARHKDRGTVASLGAAALMLAASAFIVVATVSFTARVWGPGMARGIAELLF